MDIIEKIKAVWIPALSNINKSNWFTRLSEGNLEIEHYSSFLRETYYNAGQNPQIQAFSTVFFPQADRLIMKKYYQHAIAEIGHDVLALNDLKALGVQSSDVTSIPALPETTALIAYGYYTVQFQTPLHYLGYLFHLEFMPTTSGETYIQNLKGLGIPDQALSFLIEHSEVDIQHNKMMKRYLDHFVQNEDDLRVVVQSALVTAKLHANMIFASFQRAQDNIDNKSTTKVDLAS